MAKKKQKYSVKHLDRHGRKWRWRRTIDSTPVCILFDAPSEQAACTQVLAFEKHPHLLVSGNWEREVETHIQDKLAQKLITKTYADTRTRILTLAGNDIGITHPRQLTPESITQWLQSVTERTGKDATRNSYLTHLKQFTAWLKDKHKIYIDPCADIKRIRTDFIPRDTFLTNTNVRTILDAAIAKQDIELELILLLACECGMRAGEIGAARADWVDLQHGTITIPATEKDETWSRKGQIGRKKNVVIEMVSELKNHFRKHGIQSPYLLRPNQPWGKWKYRYDFKKKVRNHLTSCGFPDITIHDMRRSFGSNRVIAGRSIEQVAHWMGIHPNTAWKYYARFTPVTGEIEHGSAASSTPQEKPEAKPTDSSIKTKLSLLQELLNDGLITPDELARKRADILDSI